jgi:lysophospholipase L1-like esterase
MKNILIYGDSNVWGQGDNLKRYSAQVRWVNQLQKQLGDGYEVQPAGLPGRIAGSYDHVDQSKNGKDSFEAICRQASPLDLVIIALGTNDCKDRYDPTPNQIYDDLLWYRDAVAKLSEDVSYVAPASIMYIAPPNLRRSQDFVGSEEKRQALVALLEGSGEQVIIPGEISLSSDGVHFSPEGHEEMSKLMKTKLTEMGI